jgi:hypothetical protein
MRGKVHRTGSDGSLYCPIVVEAVAVKGFHFGLVTSRILVNIILTEVIDRTKDAVLSAPRGALHDEAC